jgi:hypothetical protein
MAYALILIPIMLQVPIFLSEGFGLIPSGVLMQILILGLANLLEVANKFVYLKFTKADPGIPVCVTWSGTAFLVLPVKMYTFILPTLGDVFEACFATFLVQVLGQLFNFVRFKYCMKERTPRQQLYNDVQNVMELSVDHYCNIVVFLAAVCMDTRYFFYSAKIGVGGSVDVLLLVVAFVLSETLEVCHGLLLLVCVPSSQKYSDTMKAVFSKRAHLLLIPAFLWITFAATAGIFRVRSHCLVCGASLPDYLCFD